MKKIPHFKRDTFIYISNLKDVTASKTHPITLKRDGYLLSEQYANVHLSDLANWVKKRSNLLISDNGNFTRMKAISKNFEEQGEVILNLALEEIEDGEKVSESTHGQRADLMLEIEKACAQNLKELDLGEIIKRQLSINPDYMIGLEDFTIPVLMMCGLMHPVFQPKAKAVKTFQDRTVELYSLQVDGTLGSQKQLDQVNKFLVLHAYDYLSAHQGAQVIKKLSPNGVAISYGGPMKSKRWITSANLGDRELMFTEKLPEPYLAATGLTMGFVNGSGSNVPVHILGVGSPILVALIGQLLQQSKAISIDSTSPFKDANVGTLYGSKSAFLKMNMHKVAAYSLIMNEPYSSTTPFFKQFEKDFPSNWAALRSELGVTTASDLKEVAETLKAERGLVEQHIPFFSTMRSGNDAMITQLRMDRAGHNYWILRNICVSVRIRLHDPQKMGKWMRYQINRYKAVASKKWSKAIEISFEISMDG